MFIKENEGGIHINRVTMLREKMSLVSLYEKVIKATPILNIIKNDDKLVIYISVLWIKSRFAT